MERRSFFKALALGIAALPLAVKAFGKARPPLVQYGQPRLWVSEPKQKICMTMNPVGEYSFGRSQPYFGEIEWMNSSDIDWDYRWEGDRLIQSTRGKDCLVYKVDANPLRFTA